MTCLAGLVSKARYHLEPDKGTKLHGLIATGHAVSTRANAHAGSRARVTSMGGLYDAATLHAPLCSYCPQAMLCMTSLGCMGNSSRLGRTRHCCSSPRAAGLDRQATWHGAMGSCAADARTLSRGRAHMAAAVRRAPGDMLLLASPEAWPSCSGRKRLCRGGGAVKCACRESSPGHKHGGLV